MKNVSELKENIELRMKRCWGENCALFFISMGGITAALFAGYLVMNFLVTTGVTDSMQNPLVIAIAAALVIVMWVIAVPYKYGVRWYRLQQARGHSVHAKSVFSCYFSAKRMLQVYKLSAMLLLRKGILLIPFALLLGASIYLIIRFNDIGGGMVYNIAVVILLMLSVMIYIAYTLINVKYSAAPYLFALGHDRPAGEIIKESVRFMRGKRGYMIEIFSKCAVMLIPCILVFPMVFLVPKTMMIYTAAINEIIENGFAEDRLVDMERRD